MYSSRAPGLLGITLFIPLIACGVAPWKLAAAWPGADKDLHPCLDVTAALSLLYAMLSHSLCALQLVYRRERGDGKRCKKN